MARIEIYENNARLGSAGVVQQRSGSAVGEALSDLGRVGAGLAAQLRAEQERDLAQARARDESLDNIRLQSALLDHEDRVRAYANEQAAQFTGEGSDGAGFTKSVAEFATKDADRTIASGFNGRIDRDELPYRFKNSTRGILSQVGEQELQAGLKFQGAVSEKLIGGLSTKIANNLDSYEEARAEWLKFATSANMDRPKLQERIAAVGLAKLDMAWLQSYAGQHPEKFRDATAGSFAGTPAPELPQHLKDVVNAANDAGVDPRVMLAIGWIESKLNPNAGKPIGKDGAPMSSAEGMFQVLSARDTLQELGISADQKFDVKVVSAALSSYMKRQIGVMEKRNIPVTPGKMYMTWNMGPGVALATWQAHPDTPFAIVVNRALRSKTPEQRAKFLRNNPLMYSANMTAGQVIANYDAKMASAAKSNEKFISDSSITADDQAHKFFETLKPGGLPGIGAKELGEVQLLAKAKSAELSREQQDLNLGASIASGAVKLDMRDSDNAKAVNLFVAKQNYAQGMVEGDATAHMRAAQLIDNIGLVPEPFVNAYASAMVGGDVKSKMSTYVALADLQARNPNAFDASKFDADTRKRAEEYVALTTVSNLSPEDAVQRIDFYRSPEGKKQAEAQKAGLQTTRAAEVKALSELDILKHFDEPWTTSRPTDTEGKFIAAATDAYKEQYIFEREQGRSTEDAKANALSSLERNWGSSRVADTGNGANTQTFMPYPPEKAFQPTDVGFTWITDQAKNQAVAFAEERYPKLVAKYKEAGQSSAGPAGDLSLLWSTPFKDAIGVKLVPDLQTAHEARANKPRSYLLMVRLPNGTTDISTERFTPDQVQANREAQDRFRNSNTRIKPLDAATGAYIPTPRLN